MASHAAELFPYEDHREALDVLESMAYRRVGKIPTDWLARHILAVTEGADWPVRRAALEAVARRFAFAKRDELRVVSRPPHRQPFGASHNALA